MTHLHGYSLKRITPTHSLLRGSTDWWRTQYSFSLDPNILTDYFMNSVYILSIAVQLVTKDAESGSAKCCAELVDVM